MSVDWSPERVLYEYFDCIDQQDAAGAVQWWTEDGRAEVMTGKFIEGRDKVGRALGRIIEKYARTSHHVTNVRRMVDEEDRVVLMVYVYAFHRMVATEATWHLWARLQDEFVRTPEGWRIKDHKLMGLDGFPRRPDMPDDYYVGHPGRNPTPLRRPAQTAIDAIVSAHPAVAAGMTKLMDEAAEATALEPRYKALVVACAAAAKGQDWVVDDSVGRAKAAGLPPAEAWAAPGALMLSRGVAVAVRLAQVLLWHYGEPEPGCAGTPADGASADDYFREYFGGDKPPRIQAMADNVPALFDGYALLHRGTLRESSLPPYVVELIMCAVNAAELQTEFVRIHAEGARRVGATSEQLLEAIQAVVPLGGIAVWPGAASALGLV